MPNFSLIHTLVGDFIRSMKVFEGKLYALGGSKIYVYDGSSWNESHDLGLNIGKSLFVYNDELYASFGNPYLTVIKYDGESWANDFSDSGLSAHNVAKFAEFGGNLYLVANGDQGQGQSPGKLYKREAGVWTTELTLTIAPHSITPHGVDLLIGLTGKIIRLDETEYLAETAHAMLSVGALLYYADNNSREIRTWDGSQGAVINNYPDDLLATFYEIVEWNGKIYFSGRVLQDAQSTDLAILVEVENGLFVSEQFFPAPSASNASYIFSAEVFQGYLFLPLSYTFLQEQQLNSAADILKSDVSSCALNIDLVDVQGDDVTITASGGTGLEYSIDGETWQGSNQFLDLVDGDYIAYVRDSSGCMDQEPFSIDTVPPQNTGYKAWTTLEQYRADTGVATGLTKPNDPEDPDYVPPEFDPDTCPLP